MTDKVGQKKGLPIYEVGEEELTVSVPDNFSFETHKAIKRKAFAADHLFFGHKAAELRFKADRFEAKATEAKAMGGSKDRAAAKRLQRMQAKMGELRDQLEEQGVNVDELLGATEA